MTTETLLTKAELFARLATMPELAEAFIRFGQEITHGLMQFGARDGEREYFVITESPRGFQRAITAQEAGR